MKAQELRPRIRYKIADSDQEITLAKRLCHDVYLEFGYIEEKQPEGIIPNENDQYSKYIIALDESADVVGTVRICIGRSKTLEDWKGNIYPSHRQTVKTLELGSAFEVEALAVRKDYRGKKVNWGLYKKAFQLSKKFNLHTAIIGMDVRAYHSLVQLGWYVIQIGPAKHYYGSMTIPALLPIQIQARKVARRNRTYNEYLAA